MECEAVCCKRQRCAPGCVSHPARTGRRCRVRRSTGTGSNSTARPRPCSRRSTYLLGAGVSGAVRGRATRCLLAKFSAVVSVIHGWLRRFRCWAAAAGGGQGAVTCDTHLPCDTRPSVIAGMVTNPANDGQWRRTWPSPRSSPRQQHAAPWLHIS